MPREGLLDQKLRLLALFDLWRNANAGPLVRGYSLPVDFGEIVEIAPVLEIMCPSIGECECPTQLPLLGPRNSSVQVALKMNDRFLPTTVRQFRMIRAVEQKEHD